VSLVEYELPNITVHPSTLPVLSEICIVRSLAFGVVFCGSLFILLSLFCPFCCLSFDLRILITPLVPSNSYLTIYDECHKWSRNWLPFRSSWIHLNSLQRLSGFRFPRSLYLLWYLQALLNYKVISRNENVQSKSKKNIRN
jgi:hypothetical protein